MARSVVRPYNKNKRVKWDPDFVSRPIRLTAQIGGDVKPSKAEIQKYLHNTSGQNLPHCMNSGSKVLPDRSNMQCGSP